MKPALALAAAVLGTVPVSFASITVDMDFGALRDSSGTVLDVNHPTASFHSTLWAIIYDENNDQTLPGGLQTTSLTDTTGHSLESGDAAAAFSAFAGATISNDAIIAGDRVLAFGYTDPDFLGLATGPGVGLSVQDFEASGLTPDRQYGFYWFPGATSTTLPFVAFQVGGLNETINNTGFIGTVIPNNGANLTGGVLDSNFDGTLPTTRFEAIDAVPEPSAGLLALLGLTLLRRRR